MVNSIIRLQLVSGECQVVSNLSRTLGQHQINTSKFCIKFNEESLKLTMSGILFYVYVYKYEGRDNYKFNLGSPCLTALIKKLNLNLKNLKIEKLFDLYKIFKKLAIHSKNVVNLKSFLGSLDSLSIVHIQFND